MFRFLPGILYRLMGGGDSRDNGTLDVGPAAEEDVAAVCIQDLFDT